MKHFLIMVSCVLVAAWASPARAVSATEQQVQALQAQVNALTNQVNSLGAQVATAQSQLAGVKANPALALGPYVAVDPNPENGLAGPHVIFYGANVHIVSGSGQTVDTTRLGNLVIGYDEDSNNVAIIDGNRTGSHNLVIGPQHMFTASGGIVAGTMNFISSDFAAVTGGECNAAGGTVFPFAICFLTAGASGAASVSGGLFNTASGVDSSVSGGLFNTASGGQSSVGDGADSMANGLGSSIGGGESNQANADFSSVGGGFFNTASGPASGVSGGASNTASGREASVSGGSFNRASGVASSVGGGVHQTASGTNQTIN
jgi:outer membrane murein-binding lipoprotein Lpp